MIDTLTILAKQLNSLGFYKESIRINAIINREKHKMKLFQDPKYQQNLIKLLQRLGLNSKPEDTVNLLNASGYLSEAITENNLLLAGLSITSLVPGLESISKIITEPKIPANSELLIRIAQLIIRNQGAIKASLDKFKDPKLAPYLKYYIPDGELLIKHADRMWEAVRRWSLKINKLPPEVKDLQIDTETEIDQMLAEFNNLL